MKWISDRREKLTIPCYSGELFLIYTPFVRSQQLKSFWKYLSCLEALPSLSEQNFLAAAISIIVDNPGLKKRAI